MNASMMSEASIYAQYTLTGERTKYDRNHRYSSETNSERKQHIIMKQREI